MSGDDAEGLLRLIRSRRSVRRFTDEPVSPEDERRLLEAALWAPSGGNVQPWYFVRVRSADLKHELCTAALRQRFVADAPLVVVVCADLDRAVRAYGERGVSLYCLQDTAAATQNLLLTAHALGLGACWVGAFEEAQVARILGLEEHLRPIAIVAVGVAAEKPRSPGRRRLSSVSLER